MTFLMTTLVIALLAASIILQLYTLHKSKRIHLKLFGMENHIEQASDNAIHQLECLQALYHDLQFSASLPPTRGWAASPDFLLHIARHARNAQPEHIVECSSGVSTVVLARAAQLNGKGHVYSLEHDPIYAQKTRDELRRQGLQDHATVLDAPLETHSIEGTEYRWYRIAGLPLPAAIDCLVIDGPPAAVQKEVRYPAIPLLNGLLKSNARIFLDDAGRPDELAIVKAWGDKFGWNNTPFVQAEKGIAVLSRQVA